jgi:diacylglycerol kinase (ATP)
VDLASPAVHPLAKVAKDVAAAGVLLAAMIAATIGLVVLGPRLLALLAP